METENTKDMNETAAKIISWIFHPLFVPVYGLLIIFTAPTLFWYIPVKVKSLLLLVFMINNVLIPLSLTPFLKYRNLISSWTVEKRSERIVPLFSLMILYSITTLIMARLPIPVFIKYYFFSVTFLVLVVLVVTFWWKISLHSAGAGALSALIITLSVRMSVPLTWVLIPAVLTSGLILASRLKLNRNNPSQVYSGYLAGLLEMSLFMLLFQ